MDNNDSPNFFIEQVAQVFGQVYFCYDSSGHTFRYITSGLERLWGIKPENIDTPAALLAYVHEEDIEFLSHEYQKLLLTQEQTQAEFRIVQADHKVKWVCLSACILTGEKSAQRLIGGLAVDITEIKEYTQNITKYNDKKNSTLEILSHDLAGPFANIQGVINAIEDQVNQGDTDIQQLIAFIRQDAMRGADMIRDFVDNEFLESSQVVLHRDRVDIAGKIAIMMDNYRERQNLIAKTFTLISPEQPIFIYVDTMKFLQVMNNLVSNAIKFTHDNGSITVSVKEVEEHVLITVADNGIGIPPQVQPHLFDRFTVARREGVRGEKTTGLGMSIIKTIVVLHKGEISFESQEGVGTTFYIRLPKE